MSRLSTLTRLVALLIATGCGLAGGDTQTSAERTGTDAPGVVLHPAAKHDTSPPLSELATRFSQTGQAGGSDLDSGRGAECDREPAGCGVSPYSTAQNTQPAAPYVAPAVPAEAAAIEQKVRGPKPPVKMLTSFDGHGFGLVGPHGNGRGNNPSDNSLAVGPNHIYETVNSLTAIYTKKGELFDTTGKILFGPIGHNVVWNGFGGECERSPNGDTVVRYDQLAQRWLIVMPRFNRAQVPAGSPPGTQGKYGMCYAVSTGPSPLGPWYRYYFERELFPDYPRPAIWPDGYYVPTSTGDDVVEKHACVVDRAKMLAGGAATEQCIIIPDVNFLNNADIDGHGLPPAGAPNIMIATGGTQLRRVFRDDGIYVWKFHVDWNDRLKTRLEGPVKIQVAPYDYLCDGQLTRCVPQRDSDNRLDAQGDKIMQRVVYRNINGVEALVAVHSVNTSRGGGGVRWYEFRIDSQRDLVLHHQGTYAPDTQYRWMASPGMDRQGNIAFGFSHGGGSSYPGQRFVARLAEDTLPRMTFDETVMIEGGAPQPGTLRWQDYTTTAMDPSDDCTFWYQGDYWKAGATGYTVRIGAFRIPGCLRGTVSGSVFFDANRNGMREPNEEGLPGRPVEYAAVRRAPDTTPPPSGTATTNDAGDFSVWLPADSAYSATRYTLTARAVRGARWTPVRTGAAYWEGGSIAMQNGAYTFDLRDRDDVTRVDFGFVCTATSTGGAPLPFWTSEEGRALLASNDPPADAARGGRAGRGGRGGLPAWRPVVSVTRQLVTASGQRFTIATDVPFDSAYSQLTRWMREPSGNVAHALSKELAMASLSVAMGRMAGALSIADPVSNDWVPINTLLARVSTFIAANSSIAPGAGARATAELYRDVLGQLNTNSASVTPQSAAACPPPG